MIFLTLNRLSTRRTRRLVRLISNIGINLFHDKTQMLVELLRKTNHHGKANRYQESINDFSAKFLITTSTTDFDAQLQQNSELFDLAVNENDYSVIEDCMYSLNNLEADIRVHVFNNIFSMHESMMRNCVVEILPGAGGADAFDWVRLLSIMYLKWAAKEGFTAVLVDSDSTSEGGYRYALLKISGPNAFGWMTAEAGVHRLIRLSPVDPQRKRHTSFAQVVIYPEIMETQTANTKSILNLNDFKFDTFRSSGPGGQHVNKTDTAVRITHIPSGTVVKCQSERSQILNKKTALRIMSSKLQDMYEQSHKSQQLASKLGGDVDSWGNQIRSVIMHPYVLVKDHRSKWESSQVEAFLNGETLQEAIESALLRIHVECED